MFHQIKGNKFEIRIHNVKHLPHTHSEAFPYRENDDLDPHKRFLIKLQSTALSTKPKPPDISTQ